MDKKAIFKEIQKVLDTFQESNFTVPEVRRCLSELASTRICDACDIPSKEGIYVSQAMDDWYYANEFNQKKCLKLDMGEPYGDCCKEGCLDCGDDD